MANLKHTPIDRDYYNHQTIIVSTFLWYWQALLESMVYRRTSVEEEHDGNSEQPGMEF